MLDKLIGAQLIEFSEDKFTVKNDCGIFTFIFFEDEGCCCGFNELSNTLLISGEELERNPVITKIEKVEQSEVWDDEDHVLVTFFGEDRKLAQIDSLSSSGSGWSYGACVILKCIQTGEEDIITQW